MTDQNKTAGGPDLAQRLRDASESLKAASAPLTDEIIANAVAWIGRNNNLQGFPCHDKDVTRLFDVMRERWLIRRLSSSRHEITPTGEAFVAEHATND